MKRQYLLLAAAAVLLAAGCFAGLRYVSRSTEQLSAMTRPVLAAVEKQDWPAAQAAYSALEQDWRRHAGVWQTIIRHEDLRDIEGVMVDLQVTLAEENRAQAAKELAELLFYLEQVAENESLRLQNIL
ncbi:MAG: DUF4363 family protein [Firmicutes bacterium]|nr:DUF4363 family protein [Bacillota bacterium]